MSFDFLLWHSLRPGRTSAEAGGKGVDLPPGSGETVLVFEMDTDPTRERFGAAGKGVHFCDYLYFWSDSERKILIFVELKSANLGVFEDQLSDAIARVKKELDQSCVRKACIRAVVVLPKVAPAEKGPLDRARERMKKQGIELRWGTSTSKQNKCDIKNLFNSWRSTARGDGWRRRLSHDMEFVRKSRHGVCPSTIRPRPCGASP